VRKLREKNRAPEKKRAMEWVGEGQTPENTPARKEKAQPGGNGGQSEVCKAMERCFWEEEVSTGAWGNLGR